jgi:hypothetical protein
MFQTVMLVLLLSAGCMSTPTPYPGTGLTPDLREEGIMILGEITACKRSMCKKEGGSGYEWPMSLTAPPPAYTYQTALLKKAAKLYQVPENQLVLGEMKVGYYAEMIGTIRGWEATAPVGRKTTPSTHTL